MEIMLGATLIFLSLSLAYNIFLGYVIKKLNDEIGTMVKPPF
jgi:hypothetical protein